MLNPCLAPKHNGSVPLRSLTESWKRVASEPTPSTTAATLSKTKARRNQLPEPAKTEHDAPPSQWLPIRPIIVAIEIEIEIGIDSCSGWHLALMDRSNFAAKLCHHRTPGFSCPNPIPPPFDSETDLALRLTFPADLKLGPETYTYTAKRYTFTYTMMPRVRVRVRGVADPSDHCRNRNRNRDRFMFWLASGPHAALKPRCRVLPVPQRYPGSHVRIPSRVLSIPRPIATPTPISPRHLPLRTGSCEGRVRMQEIHFSNHRFTQIFIFSDLCPSVVLSPRRYPSFQQSVTSSLSPS
jgi:hypothetical protein